MATTHSSKQPSDQDVLRLRESSRRLVRELGFMRQTLAESQLAPSAVHAIIEVGLLPGIQARDLAELLRLDKSNTSRQLAKLQALGFIKRQVAADDARSNQLFLTRSGQDLREKIDRFATDQVSNALKLLSLGEQQQVIQALSLYADALAQESIQKTASLVSRINGNFHVGYLSGCVGEVVGLHAHYYSEVSGFGAFFETKVATELSGFVQALPSSSKNLWLYVDNGKTLASIAIDGELANGEAHLRWFIVDESLRGLGIGRQLLSKALAFADEHFDKTYLWTFKGLDAARHLYESYGFQIIKEQVGKQWGREVVEQQFCRYKSNI